MIDTKPAFLTREDGTRIAYHHTPGTGPGVIFCGGFMSDMTGTKAQALEAACQASGRTYTRFDYRGHGQSDGQFEKGTIGLWADDALAVLDQITTGPQIIVGSSMGGWIMLLAAKARPERIAGLVGIAPAPDFVLRMWEGFSDEIKATLRRDGVYRAPSEYDDEPYAITLNLIEEGRQQLVLQEDLKVSYPVRILHGMADPDVPWRQSLEIVERLQGDDIIVTFSKSGDHRLSEPDDIARLIHTVETLAQT
ncbi:MAG: alpha/beta hydrolase [Rhodospirillaceae bacterium]|jgi:pimeloyl-ACP methyl ester carboxylesterase|nr:alpha/beta hydrolase [Rhodospirillaceae bacterium]MBT4045607.1 alpha/beta hydrolase [Rhodospirillaceae bacterium]MBT4688306.1 alpha/beta hydrolase [Rhodospirillaceae bacterium]MBT5080018.1 alpha/beta hydrolase [Rhodospirillaceae bacterium]MBT5525607.1 alpha/beta hydrolase [Rhodospirillaceae bacterium]